MKQCTKCILTLTDEEFPIYKKIGETVLRRGECKYCCRRRSALSWRKKNTDKEAWNKRCRDYRLQRKKSGNHIERWDKSIGVLLHKTGAISIAKRLTVATLTGMACVYCKKDAFWGVDHIIAKSKGGTDQYSNLASCCISCNSSKQATDINVWKQDRGIALS